jgi:hypothetical protein
LERAAARVLLYVCRRGLRGVVEVAPSWMVEDILLALAVCRSENAVPKMVEDILLALVEPEFVDAF